MRKLAFPDDPLGYAFSDYYYKFANDATIKTISQLGGNDSMPVRIFFRTYREMSQLEKTALNRCKGSVLDVGAGAGCHALWLQENRHPVTAIDISAGAVDIMKRRGVKDAREVSFYFLEEKPYDTIFMMMNGIGFTGSPEGLHEFFEHVKTLIHNETVILLDSTDVSTLFSQRNSSAQIEANEPYYGVFDFIMRYKNVKSKKFYWMYLDFLSLEEFAKQHGFSAVKLHQDKNYQYLAELKLK